MNIEAAHFPSLVVPVRHGRAPAWRGLAGFIASAAFHALLLIILLSPAVQNRRHAKPQAHALVITLAAPPQPAAAAAAPAKPLAARATVPKTQAKPATANAAPHPATAAPSEAEVLDDVMGRIRDNWLEPPGAKRDFRCRVHIDYTAAGMVSRLSFPQPCGDGVLADSVRRAIWKTQPLLHTSTAGSMEIDFTP